MLALALTVAVVLVLLGVSEFLWRKSHVHPEYLRKFVHITVGSFVACWPFFLDRLEILGLSLAFVAAVGVSYYFGVFKAIHSVERLTRGELFFALAVGCLVLVANNPWIYAVALLHMGLADGLAAIVGTKFGRATRYIVFGHQKSLAGTLAFVLTSTLIFLVYFVAVQHQFTLWFIPITLAAALIENASIQGLDNLLVPLLVAASLSLVH